MKKSVRLELRKADNTAYYGEVSGLFQYLKDTTDQLRKGDYIAAISLLNSEEKIPSKLAVAILGRELTEEEKPFFYNRCASHATDKKIRQIASLCRVYRDTHQLIRSKMRELVQLDIIEDYDTEYIAANIDTLAKYANNVLNSLLSEAENL